MKRETILTILLAIALFFLWDAKCNRTDNGSNKIGTEVTIPKVKGVLESKGIIESKPIVAKPKSSNSLIKANSPQLESERGTDSLNNLLIQEQNARIEAYKQLDSIKQLQFVSDILQPKDFSHTLEDSIVKIDFKAKGFGELKNIELTYTRKEIKAIVKQYTVFLGINITSNTQLNKVGVMPSLSYLNAKGMLFTAGKDIICNDCYMAGLQTRIFSINRVKR